MKLFFIGAVLISTILNASIEVKQNMKALYKGVELTTAQEDYILDNQEILMRISKTIAKKEAKSLNKKSYINERNVVEFILNPDGSMEKLKYLSRSNERYIDKITKRVINKAYSKFPRPEEATPVRFIFIYQIGKENLPIASYDDNRPGTKSSSTSNQYQRISKGTTRFQHSSKEYVRKFETSRDGFINITYSPNLCIRNISLLTIDNQRVLLGYSPRSRVNVEIPKGKYKLLIQTVKTCNINLQYP